MAKTLAGVDQEMVHVLPLQEALISVRERFYNVNSSRQLVLAANQTLTVRWEHYQVYLEQRDSFLRAVKLVDEALSASPHSESTTMWQAQQAAVGSWQQLYHDFDTQVRFWFQTGVGDPQRLLNLLLSFERDQASILLKAQRLAQRGENISLPGHDGVSMTCFMQTWLERFEESRRLCVQNAWDGIMPYALADNSLAETYARNDAIALEFELINNKHLEFHAALKNMYAALREGRQEQALAFLAAAERAHSAMVQGFDAVRIEARSVAEHIEKIYAMARNLEAYFFRFENNVDEIIKVNASEIVQPLRASVKAIAVVLTVMLCIFVAVIVVTVSLFIIRLKEFQRTQKKIDTLQNERERAYTQMHLLFNTFPMACLLRNKEFDLVNCNLAAARLFGIDEQWNEIEESAEALGQENKWEYLQKLAVLVEPACQPDGQDSEQKARKLFEKALAVGQVCALWEYQAVDGSPLPVKISLLRVEWNGVPHVVYHIHDLRPSSIATPCE